MGWYGVKIDHSESESILIELALGSPCKISSKALRFFKTQWMEYVKYETLILILLKKRLLKIFLIIFIFVVLIFAQK